MASKREIWRCIGMTSRILVLATILLTSNFTPHLEGETACAFPGRISSEHLCAQPARKTMDIWYLEAFCRKGSTRLDGRSRAADAQLQ
jgi:hypothetical protein